MDHSSARPLPSPPSLPTCRVRARRRSGRSRAWGWEAWSRLLRPCLRPEETGWGRRGQGTGCLAGPCGKSGREPVSSSSMHDGSGWPLLPRGGRRPSGWCLPHRWTLGRSPVRHRRCRPGCPRPRAWPGHRRPPWPAGSAAAAPRHSAARRPDCHEDATTRRKQGEKLSLSRFKRR